MMRTAIVGGWGAVERLAAKWDPAATIEEVEPRLWVVRVNGRPIGMIGKEPFVKEYVQAQADELERRFAETLEELTNLL